MTTYCPDLFIRDIGNVSANTIYRVIDELGFGTIRRIEFKGNNAIVLIDWDIPNTRATRTLLEEGEHPLLLYYADNRFWKVIAYKTREERERQDKEKERQDKEKERQEKEKERQEKDQESNENPPITLSWADRRILLEKEILAKEKQINDDPKQQEYDNLRAALIRVHTQCVKEREEEEKQFMKQLRELDEREKIRLDKIRFEKEDIQTKILELLEKERQEEEEKRQEEEERRQQHMMDELAKDLDTIASAKFQEDENVSEYIPEDLVRTLDYGNVAEYYPATRAIIRERIGLKTI